ncbi:hypothetical protein ACN47E_006622 [Coniothyrium glycines]
MLTLRAPLALSILFSTGLSTAVHARSDGIINEEKGTPRPLFATSLTGGEGCDRGDLDAIRAGFAEMTALFASATPFDATSQPSVEFFGSSLRNDNYTAMISANLERAANYGKLNGSEGPVNGDVHVRCDDPMGICKIGNRREGSHTVYNVGNDAHINFCQGYFKMDSLDKKVDRKADNQMARDQLMEYYNRAALWARMVMHFSEIGQAVVQRAVPAAPNATSEWALVVSQGAMNTSVLAGVLNERPDDRPGPNFPTLKYAYGATRSKLLALLATQMPYDAMNNAENYALYALSHYVMQRKGFYPNVPIMDFPNQATVLTNENLQDGERNKYAFFDMSDVVARPAGMEAKGQPLPSAASTTQMQSLSQVGFTLAVMAYYCVTSFG